MKVLWLSHFIPYPPKGGALQRTFHLLRGCSRYHDIHLLSFDQAGWQHGASDYEQELGRFVESLSVFPIPSDASHLTKAVLALRSLGSRRSLTGMWLGSAEFRQAVENAVHDVDPDLIYLDTISLAQFVGEDVDRPVVLNHHNVESHMMSRRKSGNPLLRAVYRLEGRKLRAEEADCGRRFKLHIVCSDLDRERLGVHVPPERILTIPNAVDTGYFEFRPNRSPPTNFIFVGGLSWYPNAEAVRILVDEVWPLLKERVPASTLTIVGRNPPEWLLEAATADARISVPGFVDDVRPYLHASAAFLCPIRDGGGTKLKVLDCLASGTPLVADAIACEGIDVVDGEHVRFARTPAEYVDACVALLAEPSAARAMAEAGRQLIEARFTADAISRRLATAMDELGR